MEITTKRVVLLLAALGGVAGVIVLLLPSPRLVETAIVSRGPLRTVVLEDGETRAHDRFVVAAPVAGKTARIELHEGDPVKVGQVLVLLHPVPLDARQKEDLISRIQAAEAGQRQAEARLTRARAAWEQAHRDRERAEKLAKEGVVSSQTREQAESSEVTSQQELEAAKFAAQQATAEVKVARAGLIGTDIGRNGLPAPIPLRAPVPGRVLRILEQSERTVSAGTPLLVVGDPSLLEIVVDVLSSDGAKVRPGAPVEITEWGGDRPLAGKVRLVEPSAFTKVSALGVEEQRVNVIVDLSDPPAALGDGFRVEAEIILWAGEKILQLPSSALFRYQGNWSAFVVQKGRASRHSIEIGHRGLSAAEVLGGIEEGSEVILHPANDISEGARVRSRRL